MTATVDSLIILNLSVIMSCISIWALRCRLADMQRQMARMREALGVRGIDFEEFLKQVQQ